MVDDPFTAALFALLIVAAVVLVIFGAALAIYDRSWGPLIAYGAMGIGGLATVVAFYVVILWLGTVLMGGASG